MPTPRLSFRFETFLSASPVAQFGSLAGLVGGFAKR
jgi:hypothetical protein